MQIEDQLKAQVAYFKDQLDALQKNNIRKELWMNVAAGSAASGKSGMEINQIADSVLAHFDRRFMN